MRNYLDSVGYRIFLVAIASLHIVEYGSTDSYASRLRTWDFYKEYTATVLIGIIVFEWIYYSNKRMDQQKPWHGHVWHRLLLQVVIGWLAPLLLVFGLAALYFLLYGVNIMRTDYIYYAFPFVGLMLLIVNMLFVMMPYFLVGIQHISRQSEPLAYQSPAAEQLHRQPEARLKVQDGISTLLLEPREIAAAYIVGGKIVVREATGKEYLTDLSMDELEKTYLPPKEFYRINRQLIAARAAIIAYKPIEHYKLEVELSFPSPVDTIVSQLKSRNFREWLAAES